ncbi:MAG TPA: type II secretion system protein [Candidatus Paceibacterota bacterium]|jgi:prepilin-type N-terminal cleavage/methylation domain-containing protein|nr:type II secretion system protein [Candidatus Paceibacterota bacterium]
MNTKRGFTLIELLVVIAIIGLLSSVVLASLNGARKKGRDARRLSDMKQLQTALELYYSDHNAYPVATSQTAVGSALTGLVPTYITSISDDPLGGSYHYVYLSKSDGSFYCLGSISEGTAPASTCNTTSLGATLSGVQYTVGP